MTDAEIEIENQELHNVKEYNGIKVGTIINSKYLIYSNTFNIPLAEGCKFKILRFLYVWDKVGICCVLGYESGLPAFSVDMDTIIEILDPKYIAQVGSVINKERVRKKLNSLIDKVGNKKAIEILEYSINNNI